MRTQAEHHLLIDAKPCYGFRVICSGYPSHSVIRSVNDGGPNVRLPWDAAKPGAVRKVEARPPARRSAESSHQPCRRVARYGSKATGWLRRAGFDRDWTGTPRVRFSRTARECSYVLSLQVSPKSSQVEDTSSRQASNSPRADFGPTFFRSADLGKPSEKFARPRRDPLGMSTRA